MPGTTGSQLIPYPYIGDVVSNAGTTSLQLLAEATALKLDTQDTARTAALKRPYVSLTRSGSQSIPTETLTHISWDVETYDPYGYHNNGVNPDRVTIPVGEDGVYRYALQASWFITGASSGYMSMLETGGIRQATIYYGAGAVSMNLDGIYPMVAGDYFTFAVAQDSGSAKNLLNAFVQVWKVSEV